MVLMEEYGCGSCRVPVFPAALFLSILSVMSSSTTSCMHKKLYIIHCPRAIYLHACTHGIGAKLAVRQRLQHEVRLSKT
ncbi:uncharacterized protein BDV17DRAFT_268222 [Aspergillus undulatus]|uniref:uncharacterized protein n=1 Tax=Aspergillus undulatus TaxID=1810928 RepID=UPI003CCCDC27